MNKVYQFIFLAIFLLLMDNQIIFTNSFVMQCPYYQLHFQKIIGYSPPDNYLKQFNMILPSRKGNIYETLNTICLKICQNDEDCIAYVYLLDKNQCYGFTNLDKSIKYIKISSNLDLITNNNAIYFKKTCLNVPENCKSKLWPITIIPGSSLILQGKKTISSLITKRECAERCLFEKDFDCLSASFTPSYKNNQARFSEPNSNLEILGSCILSDKNKNIQTEAYRSGLLGEEYIENQCIERIAENITCSYELFSNSSFLLPETGYFGLTQRECQLNCSKEIRFYCQGATYIPETTIKTSECYLHSEDLISMGPRSLQFKMNSLYLRRVKCLNVSIECNNEEMIIKYSPNDWFRGKIYVSSHSEDCSVDSSGTTRSIILRLPIGNEQIENKCGIIRAYQVSPGIKRTFISTLIVIQNNVNVQTQGDRIIKVGCILTTPIGDDFNKLPDAMALGTIGNINENKLPNGESLLINSSSDEKNLILMQVIDLNKNYETNDVQIGQNLELRIIESPVNRYYDMQVISLIAKSNGQSFQLIDEHGCPIDPNIFPKLEKTITNDMKILKSKFNAFKFAGTSSVHFDAIIKFCLMKCPIVNCKNDMTTKMVKRKRRNEIDYSNNENLNQAVKVKNTLYISSVNNNKTIEGNASESAKLEVPLSLNIKVHENEPLWDGKDGLVYGDNGLVIAADLDDGKSNEIICVNQSLLVALIIFGAILQILLLASCFYLIMRYKRIASYNDDKNSLHTIHENLSYIDGSRRVRWADNSGFTF